MALNFVITTLGQLHTHERAVAHKHCPLFAYGQAEVPGQGWARLLIAFSLIKFVAFTLLAAVAGKGVAAVTVAPLGAVTTCLTARLPYAPVRPRAVHWTRRFETVVFLCVGEGFFHWLLPHPRDPFPPPRSDASTTCLRTGRYRAPLSPASLGALCCSLQTQAGDEHGWYQDLPHQKFHGFHSLLNWCDISRIRA